MKLDLNGKVGIVTGASRGIGRDIARTLASEGMQLALVARSRPELEQLAESLPTNGLVLVADLRERSAPEAVVADAVARFGKLDLLVNNAGATVRGDFLKLTDADWQDGFALKFFGAMRLSRASWSHLKSTKGAIVNIVGVGGRTGSAEFAIGGAVNAALLNLTKVLADRGIADGVRVNAINPGAIMTDRLRVRLERLAAERGLSPDDAAAEMARVLQIERFGKTDEIAAAVAFLASSVSAFTQGAVIDIDGGQTRTL
jgi:NAD(P)-dependent dehydrogenase (short-subunit alcohol dehydrogenase family)